MQCQENFYLFQSTRENSKNIINKRGILLMPTYIETICKNCKKTFKKILKRYNENIKLKRDIFCTRTCANTYKSSAINVICTNCKITIHKRPGEIKKSKSGNSFCSKSCSAT